METLIISLSLLSFILEQQQQQLLQFKRRNVPAHPHINLVQAAAHVSAVQVTGVFTVLLLLHDITAQKPELAADDRTSFSHSTADKSLMLERLNWFFNQWKRRLR